MGGRENKLRDKYRDIIKDWTRYAYIKWWDPSGCRHISLSLSFLVCVCVCGKEGVQLHRMYKCCRAISSVLKTEEVGCSEMWVPSNQTVQCCTLV